jgi:hypothetical protein
MTGPASPAEERPASTDMRSLLLAMDSVDQLRAEHTELQQYANADDAKAQLRQRLAQLYAGQGIAVSDEILDAGVDAHFDQRFVYTPPRGPAVWLARLWIARAKAAAIAAILATIAAITGTTYYFSVAAPRAAQAHIVEDAPRRADELLQFGLATHPAGADLDALNAAAARVHELAATHAPTAALRDALQNLDDTVQLLTQDATLVVVSGFRRPTPGDTALSNHYLVIEAQDASGHPLAMPVRSERSGAIERVTRFGVRVPQTVYEHFRSEKKQSGAIDDAVVGRKPRGALQPQFQLDGVESTPQGYLTQW